MHVCEEFHLVQSPGLKAGLVTCLSWIDFSTTKQYVVHHQDWQAAPGLNVVELVLRVINCDEQRH